MSFTRCQRVNDPMWWKVEKNSKDENSVLLGQYLGWGMKIILDQN